LTVNRPILVTGGSGTLGRHVVARLLAARAAGTSHLVHISIVGADRVPYSYYQAKLQAERLIQAPGLGWTILRATQLHQLVLLVASGLARLPVVPVPADTSFQPIDAAEVAERLAELALGPPAGGVPDIGGPEIRTATDLLRAYLHAAGRRRPVLPVRLPGKVFAGYRRGGHLAPDRAVGRRTWEQFLADQVGHHTPTQAEGTIAEGRA
jgi:uncharacterized protein YbjT (DUF2867 family)